MKKRTIIILSIALVAIIAGLVITLASNKTETQNSEIAETPAPTEQVVIEVPETNEPEPTTSQDTEETKEAQDATDAEETTPVEETEMPVAEETEAEETAKTTEPKTTEPKTTEPETTEELASTTETPKATQEATATPTAKATAEATTAATATPTATATSEATNNQQTIDEINEELAKYGFHISTDPDMGEEEDLGGIGGESSVDDLYDETGIRPGEGYHF